MTLHGVQSSRIYKHHHVDKAMGTLRHAEALLRDHEASMEDLRSPVGLDLLEALEHVAHAAGLYVPGIGMERHPDAPEADR